VVIELPDEEPVVFRVGRLPELLPNRLEPCPQATLAQIPNTRGTAKSRLFFIRHLLAG